MLKLLLLASMLASAAAAAKYPIVKLGTADMSMVETTPVVWKGELLRFESVRGDYNVPSPKFPVPSLQASPCPGKSCYRFRSVANPLGSAGVTPAFATGCAFGSAYVQKGSSRSDGVDTMCALTPTPDGASLK